MAWDLTGFKTLKNITALRDCLSYLKTAADSVFSPTITEPVAGQTLVFNGLTFVNSAGQPVSASSGVTQYLTATASGIGSYDLMTDSPDGTAQVEEPVTLKNTDGWVLVDGYISESPIGLDNIAGGIWTPNIYCKVSSGSHTTTLKTEYYKRTTGGIETLLFSMTSGEINWTDYQLIPDYESVQTSFACNTTDKVVIKFYVSTTSPTNITFTLVHSGTEFYSHIHTPLAVPHNSIPGLQGGSGDERYHLTQAQATIATQAASASQDGFLTSGYWTMFNNKQSALSLTTTGSSGASTLVGATLNIPTYTLAGLGGIGLTSLSSTATGLTYTNTTGVFSLTSGYAIPTTTSATNWDTAYTNRITSLTTTGSSGAATLSANTLNIPNYTLTGLGGISASSTDTLTNKRITMRVGSEASNATPSINADSYDVWKITALAANITSVTVTGTPTDWQPLVISITGTAARTITWGSSFESSTITLPTTTVTTATLDVFFRWNAATSKWRCVGVG